MMNEKFNAPLSAVDPLIAGAIDDEVARQSNGLELVASENFVSEVVPEAMGSVFANKYAEGYPKKRYYGGCKVEERADREPDQRGEHKFGGEDKKTQSQAGILPKNAVD